MDRNFLKWSKTLSLPNFSLFLLSLAVTTANLDGDQVLESYWVDPIEAAKGFIIKPYDCAFVTVLWEYDKSHQVLNYAEYV